MSVAAKQIMTAIVRVSNSEDENKKYDIVADVNVNNGTSMTSSATGEQVTNGTVILDDETKATFSQYGKSLNINYPDSDETEQSEILSAVNVFVVEAKAFIKGAIITIN